MFGYVISIVLEKMDKPFLNSGYHDHIRNDVTKRHGIVITIWRTSAIGRAALSKKALSEMKGMQEKESIMGVRVDRKIRPSGSQSDITR